MIVTAQPIGASDAEARLLVSSVGHLVEDRGGLVPPPAEDTGEVRGGQLDSPLERQQRQLAARRFA